MNRSTQSWFSILGVLGAMFGLMTLAIGHDVHATTASRVAPREVPKMAAAAPTVPFMLPTVVVVADPALVAEGDVVAAAERDALAAALIPVSIREAQAQLQKARVASKRAARVSLRLPYYAFGPDPIGGSK